MYTYSEIQKIFNSCSNWIELEKVSNQFEYLIKNNWINSKMLYDAIVLECDKAFRRIENIG